MNSNAWEMPHTKVAKVTKDKNGQRPSLGPVSGDDSQDGVAIGEGNAEEGIRRRPCNPGDRNPAGVGYSHLLLHRVAPVRSAWRHIPIQTDSADGILLEPKSDEERVWPEFLDERVISQ